MTVDSNTGVLAEVRNDIKWISKGVDQMVEAAAAAEQRLTDEIKRTQDACYVKVDSDIALVNQAAQTLQTALSALDTRVKTCETVAAAAVEKAQAAKDSAARLLWVCGGILALGVTVAVLQLQMIFELLDKLGVHK